MQAVVDGYGPTDFALADAQSLPGGMPHAPADSPESELLGVPLAEADADLLRAANPIAHITPAAPPFLILHGTADLLVPPGQSEILHAALAAAGVESTLCLIDGLGHAFLNGRQFESRPCPAVTIRSFVPSRGERIATGPAGDVRTDRTLPRPAPAPRPVGWGEHLTLIGGMTRKKRL